jgi:hypothetical protein
MIEAEGLRYMSKEQTASSRGVIAGGAQNALVADLRDQLAEIQVGTWWRWLQSQKDLLAVFKNKTPPRPGRNQRGFCAWQVWGIGPAKLDH